MKRTKYKAGQAHHVEQLSPWRSAATEKDKQTDGQVGDAHQVLVIRAGGDLAFTHYQLGFGFHATTQNEILGLLPGPNPVEHLRHVLRLLNWHCLDTLQDVTNVDPRFVGRAVGHHVARFHQSRTGLGLRMAIQPVHPFHAVFGRKIQLLLTEVEPSRSDRRQRQDDEEGANDLGLQFFHRVFSSGEYTSPYHLRHCTFGATIQAIHDR